MFAISALLLAQLPAGPVDPCSSETTASIRICLTQRLARAEADLGTVLGLARREAQSAALLDSAQTAWRRYIDRDCRAAADVYRGGSLSSVVGLSCRLDHLRTRIRFLLGDYQSDHPGRRDPAEEEPGGSLPSGDSLGDALLALEDRRFAGMIRADTTAVAALLDGELQYTHTTGRTENIEQFLGGLARRTLRYERIQPEERAVSVYGNAAIIDGRAAMRAGSPEVREFRIRYLSVYARRNDRWLLVAWQATLIP